MTRLYLLLALTLFSCGCSQSKSYPSEHTGMGTVRKVVPDKFWSIETPAITHVTDGGYVKILTPVCYGLDYAVVGMHVDLSFHWSDYGCYHIDGALEGK